MRAINASVMRQVNRTLILNRIRMRPISRAELAEETGLTRASVTQIVEELINDGLVIETSVVERSRLGRRSTQLAINPQAGYIFGVMLRPMGCYVGVTDMLGRVQKHTFDITEGRAPEEVMDAAAEIIRMQMEQMGIDTSRTYGVGVCVPGTVDYGSGALIDLPDMPGWYGFGLKDELEKRTRMRVFLENAANAQALEQRLFGGAGDNFALVQLEDTLSVGVMVHGNLYHGAPDFPMELGMCPAGSAVLNDLIPELAADEGLDGLARLLACVMCAYQVSHVVLGGKWSRTLEPRLPELLAGVRRLLPDSVRDLASLSIAHSDPVRTAVTPAYNRFFQT